MRNDSEPASSNREENESNQTLRDINEFKHYLQGVEKNLNHTRKQFSHKEIVESAGLAASGIREALHYLNIV